MKNKRGPADPGAQAPDGDDAATRVQVGLERWAALSEGDDAAARADFAPVLAEEILRVPGDPKSSERAGLVEPILRQGINDARSLGDPVAILSGTYLLLQFCDVPLDEGEGLIKESLVGVAGASVGHARTFLIVVAEFLFKASYGPLGGLQRDPLLRRALALLQPLLEGSFEPHLEWQHLVLAARLHNELGEAREAVPLLTRATTLVEPGSAEWVRATIELGLTLNDLEQHQDAAMVLDSVLPFAQTSALERPEPGDPVHRGFGLSDVASALAESLSQLQFADAAFEVLGLAFVGDDGNATRCDLQAMCGQLADDELGVLFCVSNSTTMFLFDREEALRVRVIPGASVTVWLQTFEASGWLASVFRPGRMDEILAAVGQLNDALRAVLSGLQGELVGRYRSLAVIPHRSLCLLPFWLMDACTDVAVRTVPSPSMLTNTVNTPSGAMLLSIADPDGDLPSALVESEALSQRMGPVMEVERLTGDECTLPRVLSYLPRAGWWHFAGHALSDLTEPERSFLQFHAGPTGESGSLDAAAILQLDLHDLGLVVLSACGSGVSELRIDSVTRLAGLATLLLKQGAGTVVSTLWEIGDDSSALVVDQLFAELLADTGRADVPAALKRATQHVRTMSPEAAADRFEQIAAGSSDGVVAKAAARSARRHRDSRTRAPFAETDQWGAFFISGARFLPVTTRVVE
jgi:hypothetical protein